MLKEQQTVWDLPCFTMARVGPRSNYYTGMLMMLSWRSGTRLVQDHMHVKFPFPSHTSIRITFRLLGSDVYELKISQLACFNPIRPLWWNNQLNRFQMISPKHTLALRSKHPTAFVRIPSGTGSIHAYSGSSTPSSRAQYIEQSLPQSSPRHCPVRTGGHPQGHGSRWHRGRARHFLAFLLYSMARWGPGYFLFCLVSSCHSSKCMFQG